MGRRFVVWTSLTGAVRIHRAAQQRRMGIELTTGVANEIGRVKHIQRRKGRVVPEATGGGSLGYAPRRTQIGTPRPAVERPDGKDKGQNSHKQYQMKG
jgi:hypothetical protein